MSLVSPKRISVLPLLFFASLSGAQEEPRNASTAPVAAATELRIAADPNNLPFSNERGEGFENRIAELLAKDLGLTVRYDWSAQRRGFFRDMIRHGDSQVVMGVPAD